ncbi:hypothetical protein EB795_01130 [Pseudomonas mandelii]|nr:hypothetical protein [Pseudomonas mandelii]
MEPPNWRNHIALKRCPELLGQISLLAMAPDQPPSMSPDTPPSRAGSLLQEICGVHKMWIRPGPNCRSEPARDGARSATFNVARHTAIASRLTPTGDL